MPPRVLVVGSGGREHALVRQLAASPQTPFLYAVPGNPGTAELARNLDLDVQEPARMVTFCQDEGIDLVVIGPEDPLIAGLADRLRAAGVAVFGPEAAGARIEGDKEYAKQVMTAARVPTAAYEVFDEYRAALAYLERVSFPVVVKASGAAQGKGVAVCDDLTAAVRHVDLCLSERKFGAAGARILIEECLTGPELSILAVTDGQDYALLAPSRDHKRVGAGDVGPNTGGMGAFAPVALDDVLYRRIGRDIIAPVLAELRRQGITYCGVLYAGLMLTPSGPQVLEFNCRFGDPEAQVVLPLVRDDFLALLLATTSGNLARFLAELPPPGPAAPPAWPGAALTDWNRHCVVVVGAAAGYPGSYAKGKTLQLPLRENPNTWIIHAGTRWQGRDLVTAGGRVLGAVGCGNDLSTARLRAYDLVRQVNCEGLFYRHDIAAHVGSAKG